MIEKKTKTAVFDLSSGIKTTKEIENTHKSLIGKLIKIDGKWIYDIYTNLKWVSLENLKKELLELKKEVYDDYKRDLPDVMKESKKEQILFKEYFKGYLDAIDYLINERLFGEATTDIGDCITNPRNSSVVAPKKEKKVK